MWISGPYLPGEMNDLQIVEQELMYMLDKLERIEAGSTEFIGNEEEYTKCACAQGRCELGNTHIELKVFMLCIRC